MPDSTNPYDAPGAQGSQQPQQFAASSGQPQQFAAPSAAPAQQFPAPSGQPQQFAAPSGQPQQFAAPGAQAQQFPPPVNQLPAVAPGQAAPAAPTGGFSTGGLAALGLALVPWVLFTLWWTAPIDSGLESAMSPFIGKFAIVLSVAAAAYGFTAVSKDRKEGKTAWWLGIIGAIAGILYIILFIYLIGQAIAYR